MRQSRFIVASLALALAGVALADGWVHSTDGVRVDRVAQPLPRIGINLTTLQGENMRECDQTEAAMCGWYRVVRATQPTNTVLLSRTWIVTNLVAIEVLCVTNRTEWMKANGMTW